MKKINNVIAVFSGFYVDIIIHKEVENDFKKRSFKKNFNMSFGYEETF